MTYMAEIASIVVCAFAAQSKLDSDNQIFALDNFARAFFVGRLGLAVFQEYKRRGVW